MIQCTRKFVFILCVVTVLLAEELNALPSNNERVKRSRFVVDTTDFFLRSTYGETSDNGPAEKGTLFYKPRSLQWTVHGTQKFCSESL